MHEKSCSLIFNPSHPLTSGRILGYSKNGYQSEIWDHDLRAKFPSCLIFSDIYSKIASSEEFFEKKIAEHLTTSLKRSRHFLVQWSVWRRAIYSNPCIKSWQSFMSSRTKPNTWGMCRKNASFKVFVIVIPKEGLPGRPRAIILLVWHRQRSLNLPWR